MKKVHNAIEGPGDLRLLRRGIVSEIRERFEEKFRSFAGFPELFSGRPDIAPYGSVFLDDLFCVDEKWKNATFWGMRFERCRFIGSHVERADFSGCVFEDCEIDVTHFQECDFTNTRWHKTHFSSGSPFFSKCVVTGMRIDRWACPEAVRSSEESFRLSDRTPESAYWCMDFEMPDTRLDGTKKKSVRAKFAFGGYETPVPAIVSISVDGSSKTEGIMKGKKMSVLFERAVDNGSKILQPGIWYLIPNDSGKTGVEFRDALVKSVDEAWKPDTSRLAYVEGIFSIPEALLFQAYRPTDGKLEEFLEWSGSKSWNFS